MGFIGENFNQIDLKTYLEKFRPEASSYTIPVTIIDGATNTDSDPVGWTFGKSDGQRTAANFCSLDSRGLPRHPDRSWYHLPSSFP